MRREAATASIATVSAFIGASFLGVTGCASNAIRADEIPDLPIAFVYYDAETVRGRAEKMAEETERGGRPAAAPTGGGERRTVAQVKEITRYLQGMLGIDDRMAEKRFQGRLALLDPRTGEVDIVEGARKGAIPQDWSFDHERLLFSQVVHDEIPHLYEFDVTTGDVRRLTHGKLANPEGCYGPDGRIVFTSVDPKASRPNARIMITDPGGDGPRQLSLSDHAYYPTCAPDGSAVAYTEFSPGRRTQRVVAHSPTLTGEPRILSPGKEPSFSADGRWILFTAKLKKEWTIWRIRPDGKGRASLGRGGLDERRPSLSTDKRLFVYVADTDLRKQLYIRRIDGTGNRILLADGDGDRPVW